ncbi:hypothetical protein WJX72_001212 [[Myrmecia] bisecta]|uniref:E3 ubiquitin-protein ligase CHFR n=1 Tax=[Myrmecia] bisecta TaxID=41462 RepID=A0AAW1Q6M9_9CHLO
MSPRNSLDRRQGEADIGRGREESWSEGPNTSQRADLRDRIAASICSLAFHKFDASAGGGEAPSRSSSACEDQLLAKGGGLGLQEQMSAALRNLEVRTSHSGGTFNKALVWGWLEPGSRVLPHVLLKGSGVAIGRGREAFEARKQALSSIAPAAPGVPADLDALPSRRLNEKPKAMGFVEVADGRVSRLHCIIKMGAGQGANTGLQATLEDHSSNGTFVNGEKVAKGGAAPLQDGDRVSLVLSVAPLVEQYFIYRSGDPRTDNGEYMADWIDSAVRLWSPRTSFNDKSPTALNSPMAHANSPKRRPSGRLQRTQTSRYTTAEFSTLDDFQCQICLGTLRACVALEPCGHNFCAACLSHHFASLLQSGLPLTCPLRCQQPLRVVANTAVRALVDFHSSAPQRAAALASQQFRRSLMNKGASPSARMAMWNASANARGRPGPFSSLAGPLAAASAAAAAAAAAGPSTKMDDEEEEEEEEYTEMSTLCPLHDEFLPIDAASLKSKQVEVSLRQLTGSPEEPEVVMAALEALARLAWSDDEVREEVAELRGIEGIVEAMEAFPDQEGVQCNGCLALMSLVRGEGDICQGNQWKIAKARGVEAIVAAMRAFRSHPMVQLSALLCMIPMALENSMMQAHIAALALADVLAALASHPTEADIQAKGLVVLGVLGQGEDVVHDGIRQRQLEAAAPVQIAAALDMYGSRNEEVLWAALFSLAVLVREGSNPYRPATRAVAAAGVLGHLQRAMADYKEAADAEDGGDEMIITAGDYLVKTLQPAAQRLLWERHAMLYGMGFGAAAVAAVVAVRILLRRR